MAAPLSRIHPPNIASARQRRARGVPDQAAGQGLSRSLADSPPEAQSPRGSVSFDGGSGDLSFRTVFPTGRGIFVGVQSADGLVHEQVPIDVLGRLDPAVSHLVGHLHVRGTRGDQQRVLSEYILLPTAKLVAPRSVRAGDSFVRVSA
jgi:hypothetical protein